MAIFAFFFFFGEKPRISDFDQILMEVAMVHPPSFIGALSNALALSRFEQCMKEASFAPFTE